MRAPRSERHPGAPRPRRGMVLAVVIIFLFVLTAALAAGFAVNVGERRLDDAGLQAANALSLAETGLQRVIADRAGLGLTAIPPAAAESVRVELAQGDVDVIVTQIRPAVGTQPALYLIRSHAFRERASTGGESEAEQTVTQLATWQVGMKVQAGLTSLSGILKNGQAGEISGVDHCSPPAPTVAGVAVPQSPNYTGPITPLSGSPLIDSHLGTTPQTMADSVPIAWAGIISGSSLTATVTVPPDAFPAQSQFTSDTTYWPIVKIVNPPPNPAPNSTGTPDWTLPYPGRGVLIVEGNMIVSGSNMWSGIVLVGGTATLNGNNTVAGATVTGLNVKLGYDVPVTSIANGTKQYVYNSCSVALATAKMGHLRPFPNTWSTSWPSY